MTEDSYNWFAWYPILTENTELLWLKNVDVIEINKNIECSFSLFDEPYYILVSYIKYTYYKK